MSKGEQTMYKTKLLIGILLVLAVLFAQVGMAFAAPAAQDTTITGTIVSVNPEPDADGVINTVLVTYMDGAGVEQTARISLTTAVSLGLVTVDSTITPNVVTVVAKTGDPVTIDPATVIPDQEPGDEDIHPIAAILAKFFNVEPGVVQGYHDDGYGFGVIAQAMWMAKSLGEGDMADAGQILKAKKTGDYSAFTLPDGSTPTNWGQFKKAVMGKDKKNLGIIVSGHANNDETQAHQNNGHGNGKDNNPGKGKGKDKDKNKNP
jgi:hypothetical protein